MMNKILGLLLLSVLFVACGSDDDDKDPVKAVEKEIVYPFKQALRGYAPDQVAHNATVTLTQVLPSESKGFISGSFQSSKYSITVSNYTQTNPTLELRNFTITIGSTPYNLGTCKVGGLQSEGNFAPGVEYSGNNEGLIARAIFDALVSKQQQAAIKVSYTPNEDFNDVTLQINVGGLYTYYVLAN